MRRRTIAVLAMAGLLAAAYSSAVLPPASAEKTAGEAAGSRERTKDRARERTREVERRSAIDEQAAMERRRLRDLSLLYRQAESEEEKTRILGEMRSLLELGFDRRQASLEKRLAELEAQHARMKERINEHKQRKGEIIERMLERLTFEPPARGEPRGKTDDSGQTGSRTGAPRGEHGR